MWPGEQRHALTAMLFAEPLDVRAPSSLWVSRQRRPLCRADDNERIDSNRLGATWTGGEAFWPLGTQQRVVMEFAPEASRRAEVVRPGPQHIRNGRIRIDRVHRSKPVDIPVTPELQAACDAMPNGQLIYVVNSRRRINRVIISSRWWNTTRPMPIAGSWPTVP
jgi:hypothetical protein